MSRKDNGGLAFPLASDAVGHFGGMTLRDYLAAKAMASGLVNGKITDYKDRDEFFKALSELSYSAADAMLVERAK